jgi:transposase
VLNNSRVSPAPALALHQGDRDRLADLARLPSVPSGLAKRARMVLLAAEGMPNAQIARLVGVSRPTVIAWRDRYAHGGIKALEDEPRSGRPRRIDEVDVVVATLASGGRPPQRLGITHWSARLLAAELGVSFASVARIWRKWSIQPRRVGTFKFATDPPLEPKVRDVVGLYLNPPDNAIVISVEEPFQIRPPDRPVPARRGVPAWRTHGHKRHSTGTLLAALGAASGMTSADANHHPHAQEFLRFLRRAAAAQPGVELHVMLDNNGPLRRPEVRRWLAKPESQRVTVHSGPAGCDWLDLVGIFAGLLAHQSARQGGPPSGRELAAAIGAFIDTNGGRRPAFTWIKNVSE